MASLFAFGDFDICGLISFLILACPLVFLSWCCLQHAIRWWNSLPTKHCPRCKTEPSELAIYNECDCCGCEYDKWGNILDGKETAPLKLDESDLARFNPLREEASTDYKTGGEVEQ